MPTTDLKQLARDFFDQVWNQGDESAITRMVAADVRGNDDDFGTSRDDFVEQWRSWRSAFPDIHFEIADLVTEGDTVVTRWVLTGTHTGPFLGLEPTGREVRVNGMSLDKFEDGILVQGFDGWDAVGLRRQLGMQIA